MSELAERSGDQAPVNNRRIRVFISSTFRDMMAERDALMSHTWPELRRFCRDRQVELVEVDMRWGITEEQSTRKETLKFCLDEIRACRPYFIGLLGERYGWIPGDEAFTADLTEEQPWISQLHGKSITELEIFHGVLNNPEMAGRSFFYFRDPAYSRKCGPAFQAEDAAAADKQADLKERIRQARRVAHVQLHENYPDPAALANLVLHHLRAALEAEFPQDNMPDALGREARSHESFADIRRRTYIGRDDYIKTVDDHVTNDGSPLVLLGDSGSGKSALLANWVAHWRKKHPQDFIFQHYTGGTPDSADHWQLMKRLMAEIKKWSDDPDELPTSHDDIARDFRLWLAKARLKAQHDSVRCVLILDALNQLEDHDNSRLLGWLPPEVFTGPLRLIVSTLPGDTLDAIEQHHWGTLHIEHLTDRERRQMIVDYLQRFGKKLDQVRIDRIVAAPATTNPLYLKILLDELRITGTHDKLDERLDAYLAEPDIPSLLKTVLTRHQRHYERERKGLVKEALGLIWSARRGLSETELLQLLRPADLDQLPPALWTPLRAAMEELLIDRGGILNFAHEFLRAAVREAFVPEPRDQDDFRLQMADYFEKQPASPRSCDELPWLLQKTRSFDRLRSFLLDIDCFRQIFKRNKDELRNYWAGLDEQMVKGKAYLESFKRWSDEQDWINTAIAYAANEIAYFLNDAALYKEAEPLYFTALSIFRESLGEEHPELAIALNNIADLFQTTNRTAEAEPLWRRALTIDERSFGQDHPNVARDLNNLGLLLQATNRMAEAEPLMRRALSINTKSFGEEHPRVATALNNLGKLLQDTNRMAEAEPLYHRALSIAEHSLGKEHPGVATSLHNLAQLYYATDRMDEAEPLMRRALSIHETSLGSEHPDVAGDLDNLAVLMKVTNRTDEAEPLMRRALSIEEKTFGKEHPRVATSLNNLAQLYYATDRMDEAEPLMRRALSIDEKTLCNEHPDVARDLANLALLLNTTGRPDEAEPLMRRALSIDERSLGMDHPNVSRDLNHLSVLLQDTNRRDEAEPLMRRALSILVDFTRRSGHQHPQLQSITNNYAFLLQNMGHNRGQIMANLRKLGLTMADG